MQVIDKARNNEARIKGLSDALELVWSKGELDKFEHLLVLDRNTGEVYHSVDGDENKVHFDHKLVHPDNSIIVHNHPGSCCPISLADSMNGLVTSSPIYAITADRSVTWMDGEIPNLMVEFLGPKVALMQADHVLRSVAGKLGYEKATFEDPEDTGTLPSQELVDKNGLLGHFANLQLSKLGLFNYRFNYSPVLEDRFNEAAKVLGLPPVRQQSGWRNIVEVE